MTIPDELTRLRSIIRDAQHADTLDRTRAILETALAPQPKPPREYAEAQTLADLTPDAWRIVGRHGIWDDFPRWVIPLDEIKTFQHLRDEGLISSALKRVGEDQLILARRVRDVSPARGARR